MTDLLWPSSAPPLVGERPGLAYVPRPDNPADGRFFVAYSYFPVGAALLAMTEGNDDRPATDAELSRMAGLVEQSLREGACGLSSGLEYVPGGFADTAELAALAGPLSRRGLPYSSHMRNEDDELLAAIEEALQVGRIAGAPVQIAHLKAQGRRNWWKAGPDSMRFT